MPPDPRAINFRGLVYAIFTRDHPKGQWKKARRRMHVSVSVQRQYHAHLEMAF
jgi:hypothetical protein